MRFKEVVLSFLPGTGYSLIPRVEQDEHPFDEVVSSPTAASQTQSIVMIVVLILCISTGIVGRYVITLLAGDALNQFNWAYLGFVLFVSILAFAQFHNRFFAESQGWLQVLSAISAGTFIQSIIETGKLFL